MAVPKRFDGENWVEIPKPWPLSVRLVMWWYRRTHRPRFGPCVCGCGHTVPRGWDGYHGWTP